ncbi:SAC3/GANP/Nin1/mts3/eIF-3 p25 family-domain-containing protein [Rhodocollybia butyracea]|uniref:SAC3/GANP/Nin1/mts3/eIF-3 p25 family-domain-containing protein n=1 Tax=Rhodocollybia butyracea TaxID=206335 RepID=A0A9P5PFA0_9AGAR|nr:SAC3/GANP/Nin1/mts3/eIF-3 p25 family-domain-containing protein [Rhodocollybia butyracea]
MQVATASSGPGVGRGRGVLHRNRQWVAGGESRSRSHTPHNSGNNSDSERWDHGSAPRGRGRGHGHFGSKKFVRDTSNDMSQTQPKEMEIEHVPIPVEDPFLETQEERDKFYQDLTKAREAERRMAISTGKMDDPLVPKRLSDAITMVGTCTDMCPRFERYRRERENNLFPWETLPPPNNKRVDHRKAVKAYERAAGDKTLPSDLRPPHILSKTLDYLFRELQEKEGFAETFNFLRDRTRAVRNDFTMQHEQGGVAMESHARCVRFHILALHLMHGKEDFSMNLEEQQLMNTLQSLKEFYTDQRPSQDPSHVFASELEMRIYHRLIHIRDQKERHDDVPQPIQNHPVFKLVTAFRLHVQKRSSPITKTSKLVVDNEGMMIFGDLAGQLRRVEGSSSGMIYLVACILEHLFGQETIDDIEAIRGNLGIADVIDGVDGEEEYQEQGGEESVVGQEGDYEEEDGNEEYEEDQLVDDHHPLLTSNVFSAVSSSFPSAAAPSTNGSAFSSLTTTATNPFGFGSSMNVFGKPAFGQPVGADANPPSSASPFQIQTRDTSSSHSVSPFGQPPSISNPPFATLPTCRLDVSFFKPFSFHGSPPKPTEKKIFSAPFPFPPSAPSAAPNSFSRPSFADAPPLGSTENATVSNQPTSSPPFSSTPPSTGTLNPHAMSFIPGKHTLMDAPPPSSSSSQPAAPTAFPSQQGPLRGSGATASTSSMMPSSRIIFTIWFDFLLRIPFLIFPATATAIETTHANVNDTTLFPVDGDVVISNTYGSSPTPRPTIISLPSTPTGTPSLPFTSAPIFSTSTPTSTFPAWTAGPGPTPSKSHPRLGSLKTTGLHSPAGPSGLGSGAEGGMLSPLTPLSRAGTLKTFGSIPNFGSLGSFEIPSSPSPLSLPPSLSSVSKDKGKQRASVSVASEDAVVDTDTDALEARASEFYLRKRLHSWRRWRNVAMEKMQEKKKYEEAVERGEKYREGRGKRRRSSMGPPVASASQNGLSVSVNGLKRSTGSNGIRTRSVNGYSRSSVAGSESGEESDSSEIRSPMKKRRRYPRKSGSIAPRTDEELAKRLQEGSYQGSWGKVGVNTYDARGLGFWYSLWLSLNPTVDATAIWVQTKFGVPESGCWKGESVFEIPLVPQKRSEEVKRFPGVIVFECTPLDGVEDELDRKYHILDDCSRLRDILDSISEHEDKFFVPSLVIVHWEEKDIDSQENEGDARNNKKEGKAVAKLPQDFIDMVSRAVSDELLTGYSVLSVTSATKAEDLDTRFRDALVELGNKLDVEGRLVDVLPGPGLGAVLKLFYPTFDSFVSEWLENCFSASPSYGHFNHSLYSHFLRVVIELINVIMGLMADLILNISNDILQLPEYPAQELDDVDLLYATTLQWLEGLKTQVDPSMADSMLVDLQGHQTMGKVFPTKTFIEQLWDLVHYDSEVGLISTRSSSLSSAPESYFIPTIRISSAREALEDAIKPHQLALSRSLNKYTKYNKYKRRSYVDDDTESNASTSSKRPRLSGGSLATSVSFSVPPSASTSTIDLDSEDVSLDGIQSINPDGPVGLSNGNHGNNVSENGSDGNSSTVTIAMLRELTKNLKDKYRS